MSQTETTKIQKPSYREGTKVEFKMGRATKVGKIASFSNDRKQALVTYKQDGVEKQATRALTNLLPAPKPVKA